MYGKSETSYLPRLTAAVVHTLLMLFAIWLCLGGIETVGGWLGQSWTPGDPLRRALLIAFSIILWLRMNLTTFYLLKRKFAWGEAFGVISALAIYHVGFALMGAGQAAAVNVFDLLAVGLFIVGSFLNTGSELQRKHFKDDPANKGKLYTQGLFRYARHINYFGDVLWVTGWALLTRQPLALIVPVILAGSFIFGMIPQLSVYLAERYGSDYERWSRTTARLIPFIY